MASHSAKLPGSMLQIFAMAGFTCDLRPETNDFSPRSARARFHQRLRKQLRDYDRHLHQLHHRIESALLHIKRGHRITTHHARNTRNADSFLTTVHIRYIRYSDKNLVVTPPARSRFHTAKKAEPVSLITHRCLERHYTRFYPLQNEFDSHLNVQFSACSVMDKIRFNGKTRCILSNCTGCARFIGTGCRLIIISQSCQ